MSDDSACVGLGDFASLYSSEPRLLEILIDHSSQVAAMALEIVRKKGLDLDEHLVEQAAMLHDIGIRYTHAPSIMCMGSEPYIRHGVIGAQLLRQAGCDERICRVAERHTGSGLTAREIIEQRLPLPHRDFLPETQLERLICYADKFYSKSGDPGRKPLDQVIASMARFGTASLQRFLALHDEFGT